MLNIIDEGTRKALRIVVDNSLPAVRVVRELEQIKSVRSVLQRIRVNNVTEMLAQVVIEWCDANGIKLMYVRPGKPNQNAYIERFNRSYRTEVLNPYLFVTLKQAGDLSAA